jgi:hypothetical protein
MELEAVSGLLYISDGRAQDAASAPGLLAQRAPARAGRGRGRDFLFVHLTLTGRPEESVTLAQDLLDAFTSQFYGSPGSVTAALRKAIGAVNELLLRLNLSGAATMREGAITCSVLREGELFTAQAGEAVAFVGHYHGVERLPPKAPERVTPLGRSAGVELRYYHHWLQPGNTLLLADPRMAHLGSAALEPALVSDDVEEGLEELGQLVGSGSARAILVEFSEDAAAIVPETTRPVGRMVETQPIAARPPAAQSRPPRSPSPEWPTRPIGAPLAQQPANAERPTVELASVAPTARRATARTAIGLSAFFGWVADVLRQLRPSRQEEPGDSGGWALPAIVAIIIPIIVAVVVTSVYLERGRVRRFAEIKQQINQSLGSAQQSGPDEARSHYNQVLLLAAEAETIRPGDGDIARLRQQAMAEMDQIDGVSRLTAEVLHQYDPGTAITQVALQEGLDGGLFALDSANDRIFYHRTDESYLALTGPAPEVIIFPGQAVGAHVVGRLIDMIWRPQGNNVSRDGLAVLDSNGGLVTFYPNFEDARAASLPLSSDWRTPVSITTYNERLYVLDQEAGEIWRYFPAADGFNLDEAQRLVQFEQDADLVDVVDFTIYSEDGSLILLYRDGRVRRYVNGRLLWGEVDLARNGLTSPLVTPTSVEIVGRGHTSSIFIADPGSGRVVQLSLGGIFLNQYKSLLDGVELFTLADDFAVAEVPLRIFAAIGDRLAVATQQ